MGQSEGASRESFVEEPARLVPFAVLDAGETGRRLLINSGESQRAGRRRRAGDGMALTGAMGRPRW